MLLGLEGEIVAISLAFSLLFAYLANLIASLGVCFENLAKISETTGYEGCYCIYSGSTSAFFSIFSISFFFHSLTSTFFSFSFSLIFVVFMFLL